jgi:hypothetical protein
MIPDVIELTRKNWRGELRREALSFAKYLE